jgi:DNA gyrase/topoisomerase IV subunit B
MRTSVSKKTDRKGGSCSEAICLLLEETTELVHHTAAALVAARRRGSTVGTAGASMTGATVALVLLDGILSDAADDGSTDCSEEAVVGLVAGEATGGTASQSAGKTTLAILSLSGSLLLIISMEILLAWSLEK